MIKKQGVTVLTYENINTYTVYTDGICATDFDAVYTFELYDGDVLVQTLTYSVNAYCSSMSVSDGNLKNLVSALYAYGRSAEAVKEIEFD